MAKRVRTRIEDWPEWIRPYVVERVIRRRKNQYDGGMTESRCYSVSVVPFGEMIRKEVPHYIKWRVSGTCHACHSEFESAWSNIWLRKAYKGQEFCGGCGRKEQFTEEWRKNNSEAQKRVQGLPDARKRMSKALKDSWDADPDRKERLSKSLLRVYADNDDLRRRIGDASRRNWESLEYQTKVTGHGYHHGWFISRCGRVYFASSWELMFLTWCENNLDVLEFKRCSDRVEYEKPSGGKSYYHPDFEVRKSAGVEIVEVKGGRGDFDLGERKRRAAKSFYGDRADYLIFYRSDLQRIGAFLQNRTVAEWIDRLVVDGKVVGYGFREKCPQSSP